MKLDWTSAEKRLAALKAEAEENIKLSQADIGRYPKFNDDGQSLSQLLANLNWYVQRLGELHAQAESLQLWTSKRYDIEKGLEVMRIVRVDKKAVNFAENAKYQKIADFLDIMVEASALHKRVQNARSSARDTTEAIRSRIGQLRDRQYRGS